VLTFVDMSKLKYLSRSVTASGKLSRKKHTALPKNINSAIIEAASEEDSDGENPTPDKAVTPAILQTPKDFAVEVLNELIGIVLESAGEGYSASDQIASNSLYKQNRHKLHKQVFVKVKVSSNPQQTNGTKAVVSSTEKINF
jgi:hypothetical protein